LEIPLESQKASVMQRIGFADITINFGGEGPRKEAEDVLRVKVKPIRTEEHREWPSYECEKISAKLAIAF
jgi:hypothetical protein